MVPTSSLRAPRFLALLVYAATGLGSCGQPAVPSDGAAADLAPADDVPQDASCVELRAHTYCRPPGAPCYELQTPDGALDPSNAFC
jgi:hypothetical protein